MKELAKQALRNTAEELAFHITEIDFILADTRAKKALCEVTVKILDKEFANTMIETNVVHNLVEQLRAQNVRGCFSDDGEDNDN